MATIPPNNKDNSAQNLADLKTEKDILIDITEEYKKQNKAAGVNNSYTQQLVSASTKLRNLIQDTEDITSRIGNTLIKRTTYTNTLAKLEGEIKSLAADRLIIDKKSDDYDQQRATVLKKRQEELKKVMSDEQLQATRAEKTANQEKEQGDKLAELEKKKKTDTASYMQAWRKFGKDIDKNTEAQDKLLKIQEKRKEIESDIASISKNQYIVAANLNDAQTKAATKARDIFKSQAQAIDDSNKKLRTGNFLKELLQRIPGLSAFAELPKQVEMFGAALSGVLLAVTAIVVAVKAIVGAIFKVDNQITDIAKNLGISKNAATVLRQSLADMVKSTNASSDNLANLYITADNLVEAASQINESFGTSAFLSGKQLKDQIEMTKVIGLSVEASDKLQQLAELIGQDTKQTRLDIEDQVLALDKQTGIRLNARKVIEQVAKIEGQLAVQYKNNPSLIAQAVVQAQRFGLTLEAAKKSADSLLDFETSIDAQLEAQLLTDKALNFENARELALRGDSAGAAADLLKQIGGITEYQKLNVIQQQSLAKSIGMSADELSNTLRYQQLLTNLSSEQRKNLDSVLSKYKGTSEYAEKLKDLQAATNANELDHNLQQISIQSQFEASMSKVRDALASIVTPAFINALKSFANFFTDTVNMFAGSSTTAANEQASKNLSNATSIHDGLISPQGNVVVSTPKGDIIPDKNDSIIATTNPGGLLGGNGDMSAIAVKLDKLIEIIERGGNIYMDSKKVGTTQALSYSSYK